MRCGFAKFIPAVLVWALTPLAAHAGVIWNESTSGNLSADQTNPTALNLSLGTNSIVGSVGAMAATPNKQDWVSITIPQGDVLSTLVLASFVSTDTEGFMGFQDGSSFVGNSQTATPYTGYTHWGTAATNGTLLPVDLVGQDLLSLMADPTIAAGATGFTDPLSAGTYTFLIQQSGVTTNYQLDFNVTAAPEPASLAMFAGVLALGFRGRKGKNPAGVRQTDSGTL